MLSKALSGGLAAVALAVVSSVSLPAPVSAASITFTFGSTVSHSTWHHGRRAIQVCRTKYEWRHHHKVAVGIVCHWTYPKHPPMKPIHPMHPKKY
jgi:hypothetical protein